MSKLKITHPIIIIILLQIWEHMESVTMVLYLSCDRIYLAIWWPIYTSTLGLFEWYFFALSPSNCPIASFDQDYLLLFFRLKSTCSLRLWCFTHHATSSFGTSIMVGFVYLLLAYLYATSLLVFYFFFYVAVRLSICLLQVRD